MGANPSQNIRSWRAPTLSWPVMSDVGAGLDGAVACGTRVAGYDPAGGVVLRGKPFASFLTDPNFTTTAAHLVSGSPDPEIARRLETPVELAPAARRALEATTDAVPARRLTAMLSALSLPPVTETPAALAALGAIATSVLALAGERDVRKGTPATRLARALAGRGSKDEISRVALRLELALVALSDDDLEPTTFAGLVVASCLSETSAALGAAAAAAEGERSLGALAPLVASFAGEPHEGTRRIPGFGHRVFAGADPRVSMLFAAIEPLAREDTALSIASARARAFERTGTERLAARGIAPNVLLPAATLLAASGVPPSLAPVVGFLARSAGLLARMAEMGTGGRIFRPLDRYAPGGARS